MDFMLATCPSVLGIHRMSLGLFECVSILGDKMELLLRRVLLGSRIAKIVALISPPLLIW